MKKMFCMLTTLLMLLSCTVASANSFTDLFGSFEHINAKLDPVTNDCEIKPKESAFTAYSTNGNSFLPVFARMGDTLTNIVVIKGKNMLVDYSGHAMIVTEKYTYKIDGESNPASTLTIDGELYGCFIMPMAAVPMYKDIATSSTVTIRLGLDNAYSAAEFQLGAEAKALFGAVYEAYRKYDAVLDNDLMDDAVDTISNSRLTFRREANIPSIWD